MSAPGQAVLPDTPRTLFRIGEVSRLTATKPFVLRYWETEFPMLQPVKSPKGHRLYRREDIETVLQIKRLLYDEGFTIAGARRHLSEGHGNGDGAAVPAAETAHAAERPTAEKTAVTLSRVALLELRDSLRAFLTHLERR